MKTFILLFIALYSSAIAAPLPPGSVSITCLNCTKAQSSALPALLTKYQTIRDSAGFESYFLNQTKIDESQGLTNAQIVAKLRANPVKTTLSFYSVPWYLKPFHKECGADSSTGTISMKDSCYAAYTDCQKIAFFAHEISHYDSFTHNTAGNQESGNEHTVPYLDEYAIEANCK
jgi:hypothetical protein